jgi:hypothetical protein
LRVERPDGPRERAVQLVERHARLQRRRVHIVRPGAGQTHDGDLVLEQLGALQRIDDIQTPLKIFLLRLKFIDIPGKVLEFRNPFLLLLNPTFNFLNLGRDVPIGDGADHHRGSPESA